MLARVLLFCYLLALTSCAGKTSHVSYTKSSYSQLRNWSKDDHAKALATYVKSCARSKKIDTAEVFASLPKDKIKQEWNKVCLIAKKSKNPRAFFENNFTPYLVSNKNKERGLFTGYYEVEIEGSIEKTKKHSHPIYLHSKHSKNSRADIEKGVLKGKNLEIAYTNDKARLFFMHIQGSGKIKIADGSYIKLGYAGQNGYPYYAIGSYLTQNNLIDKNTASAESIIKWINDNPNKAAKVMHLNPSYVFFKKRKELHPVGAMGVEVTPMRTLAVDRKYIPLGAPLWLETTYPKVRQSKLEKPFDRIMIAQDVGGAIKGAVRGDVFFGSDKQAELYAWYMKNMGRYFILVPNKIANYLK